MTQPRPFRVAVIGCGAIGGAHAEAIGAAPDAELVAAVDPSEAMRTRAREAWGCRVFAGLEELLEAEPIDAACVCAPPWRHRGLAQRLLDAGVHVLCEKPLAPTVPDAAAMAERARRADRVLMVSSKFRYVDDLAEARRRIAAGEIGRPVFFEVTFCARVPVEGQWKARPEVSGGGVVMDNGAHAYDVLSVVLDSPLAVVGASFGPRVLAPEVEDTAEVLVRSADGALGRVALSWTYFTKDLDYVMVQGTEGGLRVGWDGGRIRRHGSREWAPFGTGYDKARAFSRQWAAFLDRIRRGAAPDDAEDGLRAIRFIIAAYAASPNGSVA